MVDLRDGRGQRILEGAVSQTRHYRFEKFQLLGRGAEMAEAEVSFIEKDEIYPFLYLAFLNRMNQPKGEKVSEDSLVEMMSKYLKGVRPRFVH